MFAAAFFMLVASCPLASLALTQDEYDTTYDYMYSYWRGDGSTSMPTALRLGFHDCVGGCDGCLNVDNDSNAGLSDIVGTLEDVYTDVTNGFNTMMTRADFWAISTVATVDAGIKTANFKAGCTVRGEGGEFCAVPQLNINFQWGRVDCDSADAPYTADEHDFPAATMSGSEMFEYFNDEFGLTSNQTAALMGAHTVGACNRANSGYLGIWTTGAVREFDNTFYKHMVEDSSTLAWSNVDLNAANTGTRATRKWQWNGTWANGDEDAMMLNTDFEVFYTLDLDDDAMAGCDVQSDSLTCAKSETYDKAMEYAQDVDVFIEDFGEALTIMMENVADGVVLQDLE